MSWPEFLRDADGAIVLEEVDEDGGTATYRVYGRRSVTVSRRWVPRRVPLVLRAALDPPALRALRPREPLAMKPAAFEYVAPRSVAEALDALAAEGAWVLRAGSR